MEKLTTLTHKLNIVKEERATGSVAGNVYIAYIKASQSWLPIVAFLFLQLSRIVSEIMMMLAQANWATQSFNHENSEEYLKQCGIYLVTYFISSLGSALLLAIILVNSARWVNYLLFFSLDILPGLLWSKSDFYLARFRQFGHNGVLG